MLIDDVLAVDMVFFVIFLSAMLAQAHNRNSSASHMRIIYVSIFIKRTFLLGLMQIAIYFQIVYR